MIRPTCLLFTAFLIAGLVVPRCLAQAAASPAAQASAPAAKSTPAAVDLSASAQQGIELAEKGRCREALPLLKKSIPHLSDKQLKFEAAMASARCAMSLDQVETTVDTLLLLNREYPHNPEVLYVTVHYFSELANRSEQDLVNSAPGSYQVHKLDAEGLESQEKWDEAIAHFSQALKMDSGFEEAYLGLGMALNAAGKNAEAVGPLETYVKMEAADPAGHYQLSIAYAKLGRKDDATREMALQREAEIKAQAQEGSGGRPQ
jgi:tetratricopeptide (TPR) repeat protein